MKAIFIIASFLIATVLADKWAMVMGTASGWSNYSITSNPCRAYDLVAASGVAPEHIISMSYTGNYEYYGNPFPHQIFTDPAEGQGKDYAPGCRSHIDYDDNMINPNILMAILTGDKDRVTALTGIEEPKVFETTEEDTIFIYFIDHGDEGIVVVGGHYLTDTQLMDTFKTMHEKKMYKELVFFMEACHSGSMFVNLPTDWNIYALTSSDPYHNAWMSNCPPYDVINGKEMNTCLAGLYDNAWMEAVEQSSTGNITIASIFDYTNKAVLKEGSDQVVSQYGDVDTFSKYPINRFIGDKPISTRSNSNGKVHNVVKYENVPRHIATWKAIRADKKDLESAVEELSKIVMKETMNEITLMRLARAVSKNDVAAEQLRTMKANSYDQTCAREVTISLYEKCGFEAPLSESARNIVHNVCAKSLNNNVIDYSSICM